LISTAAESIPTESIDLHIGFTKTGKQFGYSILLLLDRQDLQGSETIDPCPNRSLLIIQRVDNPKATLA
jgi:hypothetical protein